MLRVFLVWHKINRINKAKRN